MYCKASVFDRWIFEKALKRCLRLWEIDFHKLSILMHFQRNFEFSARSAKMKRGTIFLISVCAAQLFCAFSLVCDCIFLLSCYIVLLSCLLSFVVLPVWFHSDFTLLAVLCLIRAAFSHPFVSFWLGPVWL